MRDIEELTKALIEVRRESGATTESELIWDEPALDGELSKPELALLWLLIEKQTVPFEWAEDVCGDSAAIFGLLHRRGLRSGNAGASERPCIVPQFHVLHLRFTRVRLLYTLTAQGKAAIAKWFAKQVLGMPIFGAVPVRLGLALILQSSVTSDELLRVDGRIKLWTLIRELYARDMQVPCVGAEGVFDHSGEARLRRKRPVNPSLAAS